MNYAACIILLSLEAGHLTLTNHVAMQFSRLTF